MATGCGPKRCFYAASTNILSNIGGIPRCPLLTKGSHDESSRVAMAMAMAMVAADAGQRGSVDRGGVGRDGWKRGEAGRASEDREPVRAGRMGQGGICAFVFASAQRRSRGFLGYGLPPLAVFQLLSVAAVLPVAREVHPKMPRGPRRAERRTAFDHRQRRAFLCGTGESLYGRLWAKPAHQKGASPIEHVFSNLHVFDAEAIAVAGGVSPGRENRRSAGSGPGAGGFAHDQAPLRSAARPSLLSAAERRGRKDRYAIARVEISANRHRQDPRSLGL